MKYETSITKKEAHAHLGREVIDGRGLATTPELRRACVDIARARLFASFAGSELCPVELAAFTEFSVQDLTQARIVLDVGGSYTAAEALGEDYVR